MQSTEEIRANIYIRLKLLAEKMKISIEEAAVFILGGGVISPVAKQHSAI